MVDFSKMMQASKLKEQQGLKSALEQAILTGQGTPKLLEAITFRHDKDHGELKWKTNFNDGNEVVIGCVWTCKGCGELVMSDEINNYYIDVAGPMKQAEDHSMDQQNRATFMLKCLVDELDGLTEWEQGFIESVEKRVNRGQDLSDKQEAVLEKIYNKHN